MFVDAPCNHHLFKELQKWTPDQCHLTLTVYRNQCNSALYKNSNYYCYYYYLNTLLTKNDRTNMRPETIPLWNQVSARQHVPPPSSQVQQHTSGYSVTILGDLFLFLFCILHAASLPTWSSAIQQSLLNYSSPRLVRTPLHPSKSVPT